MGPLVDKDGYLSDWGLTFFQQLISELQTNVGNEGLVAPSQSNQAVGSYPGHVITIQNAKNIQGQFTCAPGTLVYDTTNNNLLVAITQPGTPPFPQFKIVTVS